MLILVVPVSAWTLSIESVIASSKGPSARSTRTWDGKRKAAATPHACHQEGKEGPKQKTIKAKDQ
jgi:hypothetical protein